MIKNLGEKITCSCLTAAIAGSMLLLTGCNYAEKFELMNRAPAIMQVPDEKVYRIDMIELEEEAGSEAAEATLPEKKEITMSIEECRALAIENNLELRAELIQPTITKEGIDQAEAGFEPSFSGRTSYSKTDSPSASSIDATKSESVVTNLSVSIPLRTGGTLTYGLSDTYSKSDSIYYKPESYSNDFSVSISQPLLRNAGKNASTYSIRVAQYNSKMADITAKISAIRIIAEVDKAYWNLYASRRALEVRLQQYELSKTTYEETKRFVEVGVKAKIEIIRTEKRMADARSLIISAENTVRQRERELKRLINKKGLGMETKTIIIPSSAPAPIRYDIDREATVEFAIENRMEMLNMELQLALDSLNIEDYRNQLLPDISFDYRYNINGLSSKNRSGAYDMLTDVDYNDHTFTLSATIPIGNKRARSRLRQAVYQRAKRLATKEDREAEIKKEVLNQIDSLDTNWQQILANRQGTILADEQYRAEKKQYELGIVNSTDLLSAQTDLADAKRNEIDAITNYQISLINFAQATGTLLGASNIEWEPVVPDEGGSIK